MYKQCTVEHRKSMLLLSRHFMKAPYWVDISILPGRNQNKLKTAILATRGKSDAYLPYLIQANYRQSSTLAILKKVHALQRICRLVHFQWWYFRFKTKCYCRVLLFLARRPKAKILRVITWFKVPENAYAVSIQSEMVVAMSKHRNGGQMSGWWHKHTIL